MIRKADAGEFMFDEDFGTGSGYQQYTINHNLGEEPDVIVVWADHQFDNAAEEHNYLIKAINTRDTTTQRQCVWQVKQTSGNYANAGGNMVGYQGGIWSVSSTSFQLSAYNGYGLPVYKGGITYKWAAICF